MKVSPQGKEGYTIRQSTEVNNSPKLRENKFYVSKNKHHKRQMTHLWQCSSKSETHY